MPFFQHLPNIQTSLKPINPLTVGKIAGAITALGIGSHLTFNVLTGRLGKHWLQGTVDTDETSQEKVKQEEIIMHKLDQVLHKQETLIDHNLRKKEGLINKMNKLVPRGRKKI
jgi:hydrogenase small subunit